mmetsp:Transcript_26040/g.84782  ORF Transcript_26040/g.84782 Transcript_26040/m.84782 type:complete len:251 (+) Transcript_26040:782-1534(+)
MPPAKARHGSGGGAGERRADGLVDAGLAPLAVDVSGAHLVGGDGARRRCAQHHEQLGARDGAGEQRRVREVKVRGRLLVGQPPEEQGLEGSWRRAPRRYAVGSGRCVGEYAGRQRRPVSRWSYKRRAGSHRARRGGAHIVSAQRPAVPQVPRVALPQVCALPLSAAQHRSRRPEPVEKVDLAPVRQHERVRPKPRLQLARACLLHADVDHRRQAKQAAWSLEAVASLCDASLAQRQQAVGQLGVHRAAGA